MVMPGDNVEMTVELITPIAMDKELRFAIREGGRTVGAGVVAEIIAKLRARSYGSRRYGQHGTAGHARAPGEGGSRAMWIQNSRQYLT